MELRYPHSDRLLEPVLRATEMPRGHTSHSDDKECMRDGYIDSFEKPAEGHTF